MCRITRTTFLFGLSALLSTAAGPPLFADPCGMVPPVHIQGPLPLERIGLQKTYVFYRDGVESFVIRPGFRGRVEDFGMLIPFPTPPSLRKVPDETFAHIAAAIDPPEVVVDLTPVQRFAMETASMAAPSSSVDAAIADEESVVVLRQEAVGMYEVAVLEAGSAMALNSWMTEHGYRYPEGMDDVCDDYVRDGWCFVAVKTRVGNKQGVDPRPGQKSIDASLPTGSAFDGYVQGMGFRFRSKELVVPMRLSAFNEGDMHNVVYLLTDQPMKAEDMPAGHVVRQVDGEVLMKHVTEPLPLRIIGGDYDDIPEARRASLKQQRNPEPHNGIAKVLFAGDLEAAATGQLAHHHEQLEKDLLAIGEFLDLRGPDIDALHDQALQAERAEIAQAAIRQLNGMTMTVIDGEFDREVVAADNLHFTSFKMNPDRNQPTRYNARLFGPGPNGANGELAASRSTVDPEHGLIILQPAAGQSTRTSLLALAGVLVTVVLAVVWLIRRRHRSTLLVLLCCSLATTSIAQEPNSDAPADEQAPGESRVAAILEELESGPDRAAALSQISRLTQSELSDLAKIASDADDLRSRGWAVVCLGHQQSEDTEVFLQRLSNDQQQPALVRCWANAALIRQAGRFEDLQPLAAQCTALPALKRPLTIKITQLAQTAEPGVETLLQLAARDHHMQQALAPLLMQAPVSELATVLLTDNDQNIRRQAAAWLATRKQQSGDRVNEAILDAVAFDAAVEYVPWHGGPLFVPGINWQKDDAVRLINELTAWWVWCHAHDQMDEVSKIHTNVNSWQLMRAAGFQAVPQSLTQWLETWQKVIGEQEMEKLMERTGYQFQPASLQKRQ